MGPFRRFWRYLKALVNGKLDQWEDPEIIINEAVREMKENQIKNRELAVQAITQKNNLQAEVDKEERLVAEYERKATMALQGGNRELAKQFLKEKALHDQTLQSMRTNLAAATEASEKVKIAIKNEEERIRVRTAEALAMKANMKQAQIQIKINKALDQFQFSDNENQWAHAQERIQSMQSEAAARGEIANTSMDSKLREMEVSQMDVQAENELEQLEQRLSLGGSPAANYTTNNVQQIQTLGGGAVSANGNGAAAPESDLDRQLRELEAKLNKK
ncbi:MAG TPA: PspA/IM30 family protein [Chthonomonadaceae bacterium]|nr:PspA/IM30 family protein [Chthonomonadaceae bacterium]